MTRETFERLNGFDSEYYLSQDFELMYRHLTTGGKIEVLRECLISYLIHEASETTNMHLRQRATADYVLMRSLGETKNLNDFVEDRVKLKKLLRQAESDSLIRDFLVQSSLGHRFAFVSLLRSFFYAPIRFLRKAWRQGPFGLLKRKSKVGLNN
jgi:hypothetical protein